VIEFEVKFCNAPALVCRLHDTELAKKYYALLKNQYFQDPNPLFRDQQKYTMEYFLQLVDRAETELGWNWHKEKYDLATTTLLHKDIEQYLAQGFENIPEEYDEILHELHFALHAIENNSKRDSWLQIEWTNDAGFNITEDEYPAKIKLEFGDIRLQNPYVGHHPLYVYEQKDTYNIDQTCKFHNFVKPGINLAIIPSNEYKFSLDQYLAWFNKHAPNFVQHNGQAQLIKFTGHPVIGTVINLEDLETLVAMPVIEFESLNFNESK
jgi:hypothetical protein